MTNIEISQAVRKELKENGITAKQVSVSCKYAGYETSLTATIKDLHVSASLVKSIINKYEEVDYCKRSGEVLQGGNTFARVSFDNTAIRTAREVKMELAKQIFERRNEVEVGEGITIQDIGNKTLVFYPHCFNCSLPVLTLSNKPEGWEDMNCYCLDREVQYIAHNDYHIAEALVYLEFQHGFKVDVKEVRSC